MRIDDLETYGLPSGALKILRKKGFEELYPPQEEAVEDGVLDNDSLVLSVPTASGKTFVAEVAMLNSIYNGGTALYVVPLRALASEKYEEFKKYEEHGFKVGISTGDYDTKADYLADFDIIVTTSERADSMLRTGTKWLESLDVMVFDEIHLIDSGNRGPTLEATIAKLKMLNPDAQVLALSATITNADEISEWLDAKLVKSDWRPVELRKGVLYGKRIDFPLDGDEKLECSAKDKASALVKDVVQKGGQAVVFASTRRNSRVAARRASKSIGGELSVKEKDILKDISENVLGSGEQTTESRKLADFICRGAAFHHAGLLSEHRKIVESGFRNGHIKAVCATPTLAWGVNLPARRVVVRSYKRYDPNYGMKPIPVLDVKQMFGRAGRPGMDPYGEAILISKNRREKRELIDHYILGEAEDVTSKLASEPALRSHVLSLIASELAREMDDIMDFVDKTFYPIQNESGDISLKIRKVIDFLSDEEFIRVENGGKMYSTSLGNRVSQLYIDPKSASIILDRLASNLDKDIEFIHMVCETPDMDLLYMRKKDYDMVQSFLSEYKGETGDRGQIEGDRSDEWFLAEVKTAMMLKDWISEVKDEDMADKFGVGSGDIRRRSSTAEWLLHSSAELSKETTQLYINKLRSLSSRMKYGVSEEVLNLTRLPGIGRVRARRLHDSGFTTRSEIKEAKAEDLKKIPGIGKKTVEKIKKDIERY